ncbi:MAG: VWA domain-containing protein [Lachnospiraceae bacterium]|nr:VWA domain-containing protein [Lachnospiraceae bacterium]
MKKNLTEVVFILDRSGSMSGLESDTIGGFNSMITKQKKEEGEAYITTVLFDDKIETLHDRIEIGKVEPMNDSQYFTRGCTALLDAIGRTVNHISDIHKYAREEDRPEKTIFIITTDGLENASREFSYDKIKKLLTKKQEKDGWEFLFLGANIDAIEVAGKMGISRDDACDYVCDEAGTALNFDVMSNVIGSVRRARSRKEAKMAKMACCEAIRDDYANRG